MAKAETKMPEEFLLKLSRLGDKTDEIIPRVLEAGGEVALAKVKGNLSSAVGRETKEKSRATGELQRSLGLSPAKQKRDGSGWDIKVGFAEPRPDGKRNAMIAGILEHGRSGQPARPFISATKNAVKGPATEAMVAAFNKEVDGL